MDTDHKHAHQLGKQLQARLAELLVDASRQLNVSGWRLAPGVKLKETTTALPHYDTATGVLTVRGTLEVKVWREAGEAPATLDEAWERLLQERRAMSDSE